MVSGRSARDAFVFGDMGEWTGMRLSRSRVVYARYAEQRKRLSLTTTISVVQVGRLVRTAFEGSYAKNATRV